MKFKSSLFVSILLASSSFLSAGERVYLACGSAGVRMAEFDSASGTLSSPVEAISLQNSGFLAMHPEKPVLYSTCNLDEGTKWRGGVAALQILEGGTLEVLNQVSTQGNGSCHVSIDATGNVAFAANYGSGSVASFQVKEDGSLSEAVSAIAHPGSSVHPQRQKEAHAHYFAAGPHNQFAYVPDLGLDKVLIYRFEPETAALTAAGAGLTEAGAGPRHMKFSLDGKFAYVLNELNLTVTTFKHEKESGGLTALGTVSTMPEEAEKEKMSCAEIRVHPNGKFVYTSQRDLRTNPEGSPLGRNSISVYRVTREGTLQRVQTISAGVRIPRNFNFDPSGKWILAGGQASKDIQVFEVDEKTGKLSPHGEPVSCPGGPICFLFE
ncbi:lactonase family protein [Roseibacillus persicicus]